MMNRAEQNWPDGEVIELTDYSRNENESFTEWALRVIDAALEVR